MANMFEVENDLAWM